MTRNLPYIDMIVHLVVTHALSRSNVLYTLGALVVSKLHIKHSKYLFYAVAFLSIMI